MLLLVHHADAVSPDVDPQRPLSSAGRAHANRLATGMAARGVRPAAIWHSGKLRARQTAEAMLRACNPSAEFSAIRGLQPNDPPEWIRDRLAGETRDVMVVGHMPGLPRILQLLLNEPTEGRAFPLHGAVALDADGEGWHAAWIAE
jgi:phosphohistidine phosphatase